MASWSDNQRADELSEDDVRDVSRWWVFPARQQDRPQAYRQPKYRTDLHTDREIICRFLSTIFQADPQTGQLDPQFEYARAIFHIRGPVMKCLTNAADTRNPILNEAPARDGSNFKDREQLWTYWSLQDIMSFAFARGAYKFREPSLLMTKDNWTNFLDRRAYNAACHSMEDVKTLLRMQELRLGRSFGTVRDEFKWVEPFIKSVDDVWESMIAAWRWAQRGNHRFGDALNQVMNDTSDMTRLISILLEREKSFDKMLFAEHLFGCLYDKRIQLLSSEDLTTLRDCISCDNDLSACFAQWRNVSDLYDRLSRYQHRMKELHYYRYFMDWNWNKMWERLYVLISPDLSIRDTTIHKFLNWTERNSVFAKNTFAVHPITRTQLESEQCVVCLEEFTDCSHPLGVVIMKTKCGHYFHPRCIFASWDVSSFYQNRCPLCRESAGRLRDTFVFPAEQDDREHETNDHLQMDQAWYDAIETVLLDDATPLGDAQYQPTVLSVYWRHRLEKEVLLLLRTMRSAQRQTWETVLG